MTARNPSAAASTASSPNAASQLPDSEASSVASPIAIEPMAERKDGWSEWIHPLPGFLFQCCTCGMIHQMEVAIVPKNKGDKILNKGEGRRVVVFRMSHTIPAKAAA